jgi:hypothetical protein
VERYKDQFLEHLEWYDDHPACRRGFDIDALRKYEREQRNRSWY